MIVIDASAALSALLATGQARSLLPTEQIPVPHLAEVDIASGLRRLVLARVLRADQAWAALDTWRRLGVVRHQAPRLLERIW